jgi:hypothetical protein
MALVFGGKDPAVKLHQIKGLLSGPPASPSMTRIFAILAERIGWLLDLSPARRVHDLKH